MRGETLALVALAALAACSPAAPSPPASHAPPVAPPTSSIPVEAGAPPPPIDAGAPAPPEEAREVSVELARETLFPVPIEGVDPDRLCPNHLDRSAQIRCLVSLRYAADAKAEALALALFDEAGCVPGVDVEHVMDGGYRGKLRLVPALPIGASRRHLAWVLDAARDHEAFFAGLTRAAASSGKEGPARYRYRDLAYRYFRSVRRTPSAYADGWSVAYNVDGSLNTSFEAVRETLFHEVFHLNDAARDGWSVRALGADFDAVVARCHVDTACLRPYAPGDTIVKGGTYYAFQPGNGVGEYAAELAVRYYQEHRAVLRGEPLRKKAFRCGPVENQRSWRSLVDEMFGGVDLLPACP